MAMHVMSVATALGVKEIIRLQDRDAYLLPCGTEISSREMADMIKGMESGRRYTPMLEYRGSRPPVPVQPPLKQLVCTYCGGLKRDEKGLCWGCGAP